MNLDFDPADDDTDPLYKAGQPMWTSRETFDKLVDQEEAGTDAAFFDNEGMCVTPPWTRAHIFGLFKGEHALPVPMWDSYSTIFVMAFGGFEVHYYNYEGFSHIPAGVNPTSITLLILDNQTATADCVERQWRTFAHRGNPMSMVTADWTLPSQLPELRALIREYFPELN